MEHFLRYRLFLFLFLMMIAFTTVSAEEKPADTNQPPVLQTSGTSKDSILFDNYDEVVINNYEKENVAQIRFLGNVKIRFQNNRLSARNVIVSANGNQVTELTATGNVEFQVGDTIYLCQFMSFNPSTKRGILKNVRSYLKNGSSSGTFSSSSGWYYHADQVTLLSEDKVVLEKVSFSFSPEENPTYSFYADKIYYFKDQIVYAYSDTYTVGQANFLWIPFVMQWNKGTGIETAFGQEKRIGWYMMNSMSLKPEGHQFDIGLDLYERLGQYLNVAYYLKKPLPYVKSLTVNAEAANDVRTFYDSANDRFTQLVVNNGQTNVIQQLAWHYKLNGTFETNGVSLTLNLEDLNDPFFIGKYSSRQKTFDIQDVIQPYNNSFFPSGWSDASPRTSQVQRGFTFSYMTNLTISGSWTYDRNSRTEVTNSYLNEKYYYQLSKTVFPSISFNYALPIFKDFALKVPVSRTYSSAATNITVKMDESLIQYGFSNTNVVAVSTNSLSNTISNSVSNIAENADSVWTNESTNYYKWFSFSGNAATSLDFYAEESYTTNEDLTVDDDYYYHQENLKLNANGGLFENLIKVDQSFAVNNLKKWSSYTNNLSNYIQQSALYLNSATALSMGDSWSISNSWLDLTIPYSLSYTYNMQVFRESVSTNPREASHNASFTTGANLYKSLINLTLQMSYNQTVRLTNGIEDNYMNNVLSEGCSASSSLKVWWFSASTSVALNLLQTKTNTLNWSDFYTTFTNRLSSGNTPKLSLSFAPGKGFEYLPTLSYVYDLIKQTNNTFNASMGYKFAQMSIPFFYKLELFNYQASLNWNFLSPKNTVFNLSLSTGIWLDTNWYVSFSTAVQNKRIYRYFYENATRYGEVYTEFWGNLWDSLNIFNYEGLKRGFFKIQDLNFNVKHLLNEWEMDLSFTVARKAGSYNAYYYWEPAIKVEFKLVPTSDQFPAYEKKFVPEEYQ